jgi:hypothetical protein
LSNLFDGVCVVGKQLLQAKVNDFFGGGVGFS